MHKFNMSFVFQFYVHGLTSWIWTNISTDRLNFESPSIWNSYDGFNLEHYNQPPHSKEVALVYIHLQLQGPPTWWASCKLQYICDWNTSWSCHGSVEVFICWLLAVALALMCANLGVHGAKSEEFSGLLHVSKSDPPRTCRLLESPAVIVTWAVEFLVWNVLHFQPWTIDACYVKTLLFIDRKVEVGGRGLGACWPSRSPSCESLVRLRFAIFLYYSVDK